MWCASWCLARASGERRSSCGGASPRRQRFAAAEAGAAYLAECPLTSPAGRFPPPASRIRQGLVAAGGADYPGAPRAGSRLSDLDDGGDRAPSDQDHRGAPAAGAPDRRPSRPDRSPSRPVVSPTYAQGSYYGTNRVVASAPGRFTGPATPLLSTARAAQPLGRDPRRSRSSVARTGRVSRKNRARGRGGGGGRAPAGSRVAMSAPTSTSSSSVPIVATTWRSPSGRFLAWPRCGSRRPTTRSRGQGHPADHLHAMTEADRQAAAAQQPPSAGPNTWYLAEGNGQGHHVDRAHRDTGIG